MFYVGYGVRFDRTAYTVTEGVDGDVSLRVVKSGSADIPLTVTVTTQPGTAGGWDYSTCSLHTLIIHFLTAGEDFESVVTTVTFQPEDTEKTINVKIVNDEVLEGEEMFSATLTSADKNATVSTQDTVKIKIIDGDGRFYGSSCGRCIAKIQYLVVSRSYYSIPPH